MYTDVTKVFFHALINSWDTYKVKRQVNMTYGIKTVNRLPKRAKMKIKKKDK